VSGNSAKIQQLRQEDEQKRLSRAEILTARITEEPYFIEALGGTVLLKSLTHRQRAEIRSKSGVGTPQYDESYLEVLSIVYSVADPKLTEEDVETLRDQDSNIIDELNLQIGLLNMAGYSGKGSRATENSDSPSDSANDSE